jgi:hypothetical protein
MNANFSEEFLNEKYINISMIVREDEEDFNLNLTWKVASFKGKVLNITIMFDDETKVSIFDDLDTLVFEVKNASDIFKAVNGKPLNTTKSERKVPL